MSNTKTASIIKIRTKLLYHPGDEVDPSAWNKSSPASERMVPPCIVKSVQLVRSSQTGWMILFQDSRGAVQELDQAWLHPAQPKLL